MLDLNVDAASVDSACDETDPKSATAAAHAFLAEDYSGTSSSVVSNNFNNSSAAAAAATVVAADEESNSSSGTRITTLKFSILDGASTDHIIQIDDDDDDQELMTKQLFPSPPKTQSLPLVAARPQQWLKMSVPEAGGGGGLEVGFCNMGALQPPPQQLQPQPPAKKSRRGPRSRSSPYRGVTFYRRTGRWESHIWDCGKQLYLGGFDTAHAAARAYDRAAIKFRGVNADINFQINDYEEDLKQMKNLTKEEFVHILRRQSTGFSRGSSKYRGVTLPKCGRWEARMGQFLGKKAYDKAAIQCDGREAVTNFELSAYDEECRRATKDGVRGDNLDLNLWISPSTNKLKGNDDSKNSHLQYFATSGLSEGKKVEGSSTNPDGPAMASQGSSVWASTYSNFVPNNEERPRKIRAEGIPLPGLSNWPWNTHCHSVITSVPLFSSAASSGFSPNSPYTPLLSPNTHNKIVHTTSFQHHPYIDP